MMDIHHHLSDGILRAYSAGTLPEAFSLVVATHISMCDDCRAALDAHDAVGGAVLETQAVADVDANMLAATFAKIDAMSNVRVMPTPKPTSEVPAPLQDYIGTDFASVKWKPLGMGVKQALLDTGGKEKVRLLHIPAGTAMPDHGHNGLEMTLVLKGAFLDEDDRFARGDVEIADESIDSHIPIADIGEDCICLAATDAPLRFNALIPRLLQPFIRF